MRIFNGITILTSLAIGAVTTSSALANSAGRGFGVIGHRDPVVTAQYWDPILKYVSDKSGVKLHLVAAKNGAEHSIQVGKGEPDFLYSNHNFIGGNAKVGYRVFARPQLERGRGMIVTKADSPIKSIGDLKDKEVAFPHRAAFLGYHVPMDALLKNKVEVKPSFAGNQEATIAQLVEGRAQAIGVSAQVLIAYADKTGFKYRTLWTSDRYLNLALSAHPRVAAKEVRAVADAFVHMQNDAEGFKILVAATELVKEKSTIRFMKTDNKEFANVQDFYRTTKVVIEH